MLAADPAAGLGGRRGAGRAARRPGGGGRPPPPGRSLGDLDAALEADVLVCSDHAEATEATMELMAPDRRAAPPRRREPGSGGGHRGVHRRARRR